MKDNAKYNFRLAIGILKVMLCGTSLFLYYEYPSE